MKKKTRQQHRQQQQQCGLADHQRSAALSAAAPGLQLPAERAVPAEQQPGVPQQLWQRLRAPSLLQPLSPSAGTHKQLRGVMWLLKP